MKKVLFLFIVLTFTTLMGVNAQTDYWNLEGNSGTTSSNFIGTRDFQPLIFSTNGNERMQLLPDKPFLGIGTSTPQATLHLHYQDGGWNPPISQNLLQLTTPTCTTGFSVSFNETTKSIRFTQHEEANLVLEGPGGGLVIAKDGNVGFGTDAPQEKVHIDEGNLLITTLGSSNPDVPLGALIFTDNNLLQWCIEYRNAYPSSLGSKGLSIGTYFPRNTPQSHLFLANNGMIGISNSNPQAKLDVAGSFKAKSAEITGALTADELTVNSANVSKHISSNTLAVNSANVSNSLYTNELSAIKTVAFTLTAGLLNAQNATIDGLTKTHNLRVNNLLCAKEIKVQLNSTWPDYVFYKDYNLLPLSEVEQFINENHHLPNIPSAAEVEENGINIGEMNAKLLLKVEELTLYILDLQKQINELKK